jgi:hypothetical protein
MLIKKYTSGLYIYAVLLAIYIHISSTSLILETTERYYFPLLVIFLFALVLVRISQKIKDRKLINNTIIIGLLIFILFGWQIMFSKNMKIEHYIVDLVVIQFIILNYIFFKTHITKESIKNMMKIIYVLGIPLYLFALLIGDGFESKRFQSPPIFFITLSFYFYFTAPKKAIFLKVFFLAVIILYIAISLASGDRTNFLLSLIAILAFLINNRKRNKWSLYFFYGYSALFITVIAYSFGYVLLETRFKGILSEDGDVSLVSRFYEAKDAINYFLLSDNLLYYIFGHGHGALYEIREYIGSERNLTDNIYSHHIHIMPILLLFRYGLLGFLFFIWLTIIILHAFYKKIILSKDQDDDESVLFSITALLYLLDSLLRNVLVNPFFALFLSLFLIYRFSATKQKKGSK